MKPSVQRLLDNYYPFSAHGVRFGNGTVPFYDWLLDGPGVRTATVLNIGAGPTPTSPIRRLRGRVGRLVGVDPDPIVLGNTDLDEAHVNDGINLPFPEDSFDRAYSDWTLEHVSEPRPFLAEIQRVLQPGGYYWFRTSNRTHYVTLASALTPQWFHRLVANRARMLGGDAHEPWPTRYRVNTRRVLRRELIQAGFDEIEIRLVEPEPAYMVFNPLAFRIGVAYERLVNRWDWLSEFRLILMGRARKRETREAEQVEDRRLLAGR